MAKPAIGPLKTNLLSKTQIWLLLILVVLGGCFRFYKPNWNQYHSIHPDERNILNAVSELRPETGYKVTFFAYGQLPAFLYRATGEVVSTPQFFFSLFQNHTALAILLYFIFLLLLAVFCGWFFISRKQQILNLKVPDLGLFVLGIMDLLFFLGLAFSRHGHEDWVEGLYWIFLVQLFIGSTWFFFSEKWGTTPSMTAIALFESLLFLKFFKIFSLWFDFLEGQNLNLNSVPLLKSVIPSLPVLSIVCLLLVSITSLGISALVAWILEIDWLDVPFYGALGAIFLFGILPAFLPESWHLAAVCSTMSFTLLLGIGAACFGWVTGWGRTLLGILSVWGYCAWPAHGWPSYTDGGNIMIIGHVWAAVFSTLTILAVFFFVQRAFQNTSMAFLASGCFAFAAVSIEQAHYAITESFITLMFVVVALCAYEIVRKGDWASYLWTGAAFGLALAAKTSSLYYVFIIVTAHVVFLARKSAKDWEKESKKLGENEVFYSVLAGLLLLGTVLAFGEVGLKFHGVFQDLFWRDPQLGNGIWVVLLLFLAGLGLIFAVWGGMEFRVLKAQIPQWIKLTAAGALAIFVFFLFSPWSALDRTGFMTSMNYEWDVVSHATACYVLQFKDTPRYWYQLKNLMSVELWWPLGLTAVVGMVWVLGRFLKQLAMPGRGTALVPVPFSRTLGFSFLLPDLLVLSWFIPYFGFIGCWNTKFIRYMVPLIPAFCIFAARFITDVLSWAKTHAPALGRFAKPTLWGLVLGSSLFYSIAYMHVYRYPHPWFDASVWIYKNVPAGTPIATDMWDDGLPQDLSPQQDPRMDKAMGPGMYGHVDVDVYSPMGNSESDDNDNKKNYYADTLQKAGYISLATKKLWYTLVDCTPEFRPNGYNVYPVTSRYFRLLWSGLLGYKMVGEFHNFPSFLGLEFPDDMAEETFSVYDHPRVYLFKKVEDVPRERILKLLSSDDYVRGINRDLMRTITPANVDAFIAERHQYLIDHGLLAGLEAIGTTPTANATPEIPAQPVSHEASPIAAATPVPLSAPDEKVDAPPTVPPPPDPKTLQVLEDYAKNPVIETDVNNLPPAPEEGVLYQWRAWFTWLLTLLVLGWIALPLTLKLFSPVPSGAYSFSKILGFFILSWLVWFPTTLHISRFTIGTCWFWVLALVVVSGYFYRVQWAEIKSLWVKHKKVWLAQEGAFLFMFILFTFVKLCIPHIHDPVGEGYNGGGEPMNFAFLSSIVRGESFPPQDMWMAGLPIGYTYYYGHIMMGILTKLLGLVPAVSFNLSLITVFSLIFSGAFGLAFALSGRLVSGWLAGLLCAVAGNPDGFKQYLDAIYQCFVSKSLNPLTQHVYDYWGPTRIIPPLSINEFPYFSVLYGDLHAHTLAMPFAMLLIGIIGSLYMSGKGQPVDLKRDWLGLLMLGFLLGGLAYLNTWDPPPWLILITIVLLVRNLSNLSHKIVSRGLSHLLTTVVAALTLLGWWVTLHRPTGGSSTFDIDPNALGGATIYLAAFFLLGVAGAILWLFVRKTTQVFSKRLVSIALSLGLVLVVGGVLWAPYFVQFHPQQNKIMWVLPRIRTSISDYFAIYGFFLVVLLLSFVNVFPTEIQKWIEKSRRLKSGRGFSLDKLISILEKIDLTKNVVGGMFSLGLVTLAILWGASWAHWTEPPDKTIISECFATLTVILFSLAFYFKDKLALWVGAVGVVFVWVTLLATQVIHLIEDQLPTLQLGVFSALWLLAFLHLGFAIKTSKDRALSFAYVLVSFFFFVTAILEIFVVSDYFGFGDGMRNNSLFKYGIIAWTLASVGTGVFLPRVWDFLTGLLRIVKKETYESRRVLYLMSVFFLFVLLKAILSSFISFMPVTFIGIFNIVFSCGFLIWAWLEGWIRGTITKILAIGLSSLSVLFSILSALPTFPFGTFLSVFQKWCNDLSLGILYPLTLALVVVSISYFIWEKRKNLGSWIAVRTWDLLMLAFAFSVAVYPLAATTRKCHGYLPSMRQRWMGYAESLTLDGLSYISRVDPYDAAAIRFLNEKIPDQPCLLEFVGGRYEGWSSRFSIFTGIPAIMGWDEEDEWVGARLGRDLQLRRAAVQQIFSTTDVPLAKKYLDAYGIRLVVVGMAEKYGPHLSGSGKYTPEGLGKFSSFLPLIYKNPQVEIYYNPPPENRNKT